MPDKTILLIASSIVHPPWLAVRRLQALIKGCAQRVWMAPSMEALPGLDLSDVAAVVLYFHRRNISDQALSAFDGYVSEGGGVLAVHSATASFKQNTHYFEILGGRFTSHGRVAPFEVCPVMIPKEPFTDIGSFRIRDEIYLHEVQPGVGVHFETEYQGVTVPVAWTYRYGAGRVCYAMPGHGSGVMKNPVYQEILTRGLHWVSSNG